MALAGRRRGRCHIWCSSPSLLQRPIDLLVRLHHGIGQFAKFLRLGGLENRIQARQRALPLFLHRLEFVAVLRAQLFAGAEETGAGEGTTVSPANAHAPPPPFKIQKESVRMKAEVTAR